MYSTCYSVWYSSELFQKYKFMILRARNKVTMISWSSSSLNFKWYKTILKFLIKVPIPDVPDFNFVFHNFAKIFCWMGTILGQITPIKLQMQINNSEFFRTETRFEKLQIYRKSWIFWVNFDLPCVTHAFEQTSE